ncbi:hypothetical protein F503_07234 [Ophiostoma piceae UAMH 11346]|uniref:Uncharacterized protein n=1 Tax=Ophiostoma piceae (strain UAMH 11346) TaxID=1262450 RepID=S3CS46_OPHP1|nr:hypothetical protein F503_07234 [Ophiostoma piceae UAMH 11346]
MRAGRYEAWIDKVPSGQIAGVGAVQWCAQCRPMAEQATGVTETGADKGAEDGQRRDGTNGEDDATEERAKGRDGRQRERDAGGGGPGDGGGKRKVAEEEDVSDFDAWRGGREAQSVEARTWSKGWERLSATLPAKKQQNAPERPQ